MVTREPQILHCPVQVWARGICLVPQDLLMLLMSSTVPVLAVRWPFLAGEQQQHHWASSALGGVWQNQCKCLKGVWALAGTSAWRCFVFRWVFYILVSRESVFTKGVWYFFWLLSRGEELWHAVSSLSYGNGSMWVSLCKRSGDVSYWGTKETVASCT